MQKIKIFLASSEELKQERLELAGLIGHMNLILEPKDIHIYLVKWEYLDASMSELHKQEEYNRVLDKCDICLVLFWNRFGKYTKTEFDRAFARSQEGDKKKMELLIYFKEGNEENEELKAFKDQCESTLPSHCRQITDIQSLKETFLKDFNDYQQQYLGNGCELIFNENSVTLDGKPLLNFNK